METNQIIENNKLIADFMGFRQQTDSNERWFGNWFTTPNEVWGQRIEILHFNTSWNWLMPVILKCKERQIFGSQGLINNIEKRLLEIDLLATYGNVISFIEFYNLKNKES